MPGIWGGVANATAGSRVPRNVRYIDKGKPAGIIISSYFAQFFNLPIDKTAYIGLK